MKVNKILKFVSVTITIETYEEEDMLLDILEEFCHYHRNNTDCDPRARFAIKLCNELNSLNMENENGTIKT